MSHGEASSAARILDVQVRGVELREETMDYARRQSAQMLESSGIAGRRVRVLLERTLMSTETRVYVTIENGLDVVRARGRDIDELRAVRDAFARLTERLTGQLRGEPSRRLR